MSTEVKLNFNQSRGYENYDLELIKVETNEQGQKLVSARELHEVLESKERFSKWFERMVGYGFILNNDFTPYQKVHPQNKQSIDDYVVTLEMAKHIAMVQRTEIGMRLRNYFIECEKVVRDPYAHLSKELQAIIKIDVKQQEMNQRIVKLENNMTIDYAQQLDLQRLVAIRAIKALGGNDAAAYKNKTVNRKTFNSIYKLLKNTFQVNSYRNISTKNYEMAKEVINNWLPSEELTLMIRGANSQMILGESYAG